MKATDLLGDLVTQAGVQVEVSSNVSPTFVLYDAASTEPSVFDLLGIRPHVIVKTSEGRVIAEYGEAAPKDYVLAGVYLVALTFAATLAAGLLGKLVKAI